MNPGWSDGLEVVTEVPPNAATPLHRQTGEVLGPSEVFVRSNFVVPDIDATDWVLTLDLGERVEVPLDDLMHRPSTSVDVALECAGNGRTLMQPVPAGTPWRLGAASSTSFQGISLASLLEDFGVPSGTVDLVFTGADRGRVPHHGDVAYEFSLRLREALHGDALLAWGMGEQPLTRTHGAPLRLVVPGQYAMKSVKWLTGIRATRTPFDGHFVRRYRYLSDDHEPEGAAVGPIRVRSLISAPAEGSVVDGGTLAVRGTAWSDGTPIEFVDVSLDDARTWSRAHLEPPSSPYAPQAWSSVLSVGAGTVVVVARATDAAGRVQPLSPRWNANGYANNAVHRIRVEVAG